MKMVLIVTFCSLLILCFLGTFLCLECASDAKEFEKALDLVEGEKYSQAVVILERLILKEKDSGMKSRYCYVAATCYRKLERRDKAILRYQQALGKDGFPFAYFAKHYIASIYRDLRNHRAVIEWYESLLRDHPESLFAVEARYYLGECYFALKQYETAVSHYTKFAESYPKDSRARMAVYRIGCAYQELGKYPEAYVQYKGLIRQNTKDQAAQNALGKIKSLASSHPTVITIKRDDRIYYGLVLIYARQYKAAREELKKVITDDEDSLSAEAAYYIAESYYQAGEYSTAIKEYTSAAKSYPDSNYAVKAQYQIAMCHWKSGKEGASNALLAKFAAKYPDSDLADDAEFQVAEHHKEKEGFNREVAEAYGKVAIKYPISDLVDDALWNMGWCYLKLKDNERSEQAFRRLVNEHPGSQMIVPARFWLGASCERAGKWHSAAEVYKEAMQNGGWYYPDRAKRRLESLVRLGRISEEEASVQYERVRIDNSIPAWQNVEKSTLTRTEDLLDLRLFDDAIDELLVAVGAGIALENAYYNLAVCYERMGDIRKSWAYAWKLSLLPTMKGKDGAMPRHVYRKLYPIAYRNAIFSNSEENNLDPFLVMALILEESRYDPTAGSRVGARGLMQIMPFTGKDIARQLKIHRFGTRMLFQSETNIKMGTWYLSDLISRFGDLVQKLSDEGKVSKLESDHADIVRILALGSYNGGESRLRRWAEERGIADIEEFVEDIPLDETNQYVKKVCDSYEAYKSLYKQMRDR